MFSKVFHKHSTKRTVQPVPVDREDISRTADGVSPPGVPRAPEVWPNTSTSPIQQSAASPIQTFKSMIVFASKIATSTGVPWVGLVTESVIQIIQRFEAMKLNSEASQELESTIKAFLFIVARNGSRNPNSEIVEHFKRRVLSIQSEVPAPQRSVSGFINAQDSSDMIVRLRQNLDSAVQLLQTGLQIALVDAMDEFKEWRAGIENGASGSVIKTLLNQTYNANGNLKMRTEGTGTISFAVQGSKFGTKKDYTQHTQGTSITETYENTTIDADGDIDITTIATGATSTRFM